MCNKTEVAVGLSISLTGKFRPLGQQALQGIRLWRSYINAQGGIAVRNGEKKSVRLIWYDDRSQISFARKNVFQLLLCSQAHKGINPVKWLVRSGHYKLLKTSLSRLELNGAATGWKRLNILTPLSANWSRQNGGHASITRSSEACNLPALNDSRSGTTLPSGGRLAGSRDATGEPLSFWSYFGAFFFIL